MMRIFRTATAFSAVAMLLGLQVAASNRNLVFYSNPDKFDGCTGASEYYSYEYDETVVDDQCHAVGMEERETGVSCKHTDNGGHKFGDCKSMTGFRAFSVRIQDGFEYCDVCDQPSCPEHGLKPKKLYPGCNTHTNVAGFRCYLAKGKRDAPRPEGNVNMEDMAAQLEKGDKEKRDTRKGDVNMANMAAQLGKGGNDKRDARKGNVNMAEMAAQKNGHKDKRGPGKGGKNMGNVRPEKKSPRLIFRHGVEDIDTVRYGPWTFLRYSEIYRQKVR